MIPKVKIIILVAIIAVISITAYFLVTMPQTKTVTLPSTPPGNQSQIIATSPSPTLTGGINGSIKPQEVRLNETYITINDLWILRDNVNLDLDLEYIPDPPASRDPGSFGASYDYGCTLTLDGNYLESTAINPEGAEEIQSISPSMPNVFVAYPFGLNLALPENLDVSQDKKSQARLCCKVYYVQDYFETNLVTGEAKEIRNVEPASNEVCKWAQFTWSDISGLGFHVKSWGAEPGPINCPNDFAICPTGILERVPPNCELPTCPTTGSGSQTFSLEVEISGGTAHSLKEVKILDSTGNTLASQSGTDDYFIFENVPKGEGMKVQVRDTSNGLTVTNNLQSPEDNHMILIISMGYYRPGG